MTKIKYILIALIPFIFSSCGDPYINMEINSCKLDKESYKTGENIIFTCSGNFDENDFSNGNLNLQIGFYKKIEDNNLNNLTFNIVDSDSLDFDIDYYNDLLNNEETNEPKNYIFFNTHIIENSPLTHFSKKIIFNTNEPGEYNAMICFSASDSKHPYVNDDYYSFQFTITSQ